MKAPNFQVKEISFAEGKLKLNCFNQDLPEGVPFSIDIPPQPYPEGIAIDEIISGHAPLDRFRDVLGRSGKHQPDHEPDPSDEASILGTGMQFIVDKKEKIFLINPLTMMRRHPIPVEIY